MPSSLPNSFPSLDVVTWISLMFLGHIHFGVGSTHWVVTADGRVQAQADSIFNLQCPYDVMVLLNQEKRRDLAEAIRIELLTKDTAETPDEKDTEFEKKFYAKDPNCSAAGKPLIKFDLYTGFILTHEEKGLRTEDFMSSSEFKDYRPDVNKLPICSDYVSLDFSMHTFEHLEGMVERHNLTLMEESELKFLIPMSDDLEKFGNFIASKLEKNSTSWIYYNLASHYWRMRGHSLQSIECLRRSLHFSPREFKDIALVSLSSILHRSHRPNEAAIVLHAALDISDGFSGLHFALGNIYAVLGDFNKSVICYENALRLDVDNEEAKLRKNAVQCHINLGHLLEEKHRSLQKTLDDLKQYQARHEMWQALHRKMQSEQLHSEGKMKQALFYKEHLRRVKEFTKDFHLSALDFHLISAQQSNKRIFSFENLNRVLSKDEFSLLNKTSHINSIQWKGRQLYEKTRHLKWDPLDFSKIFQRHLKDLSLIHLDDFENHISSDLDHVPYEHAHQKVDLPYLADDWPSEGECSRNVRHFPSWSEFQTVFLSLQKKGFDIAHLLGSGQGLKEGQSHPFPWYPPLCTPPPSPSSSVNIPEGPGTYDHISAVRDRASLRVKLEDPAMKEMLMMQLAQGIQQEITMEEIGQRILTALKDNVGPPWILYNLAGLFWRVSGNPLNSIECIRRALHLVPHDLRDVPIVNLASVLYKVGRVKDAIKVMKDALAINNYEPDSLFFMGNLFAAVGNISGAINYYQDALGLDPTHDSALRNLRMVLCLKKFHLNHQTLASSPSFSGSESISNEVPRGKVHDDSGDFSLDKCSKVHMEKRIPVHLYTRHGDSHLCAIPLSAEHKISNGSPKETHEGSVADEFFLHCEKIEGSSFHKIPAELLQSLSSHHSSCNSECSHLRHGNPQQQSIVIDLE